MNFNKYLHAYFTIQNCYELAYISSTYSCVHLIHQYCIHNLYICIATNISSKPKIKFKMFLAFWCTKCCFKTPPIIVSCNISLTKSLRNSTCLFRSAWRHIRISKHWTSNLAWPFACLIESYNLRCRVNRQLHENITELVQTC